MKKIFASLAVASLALGVAGCGSNSDSASSDSSSSGVLSDGVVKIGVVGADPANDKLVEVAKDNGINVEIVDLSDYNQPNPALVSGDIDMNWFQHIAYLAQYNEGNDENLKIVGPTVIYPLSLYSEKYKSVDDIPEGSEIAVPDDPSNLTRALLLLKAQGLVEFKDANNLFPTEDDIDTEKSKVKITPVEAVNTVLSMDSVSGAVVNNDFLTDAGLKPTDALAQDDPNNEASAKYVNVFAATDANKDDETLKKLNELFHTKEVLDVVAEDTQNTAVEVKTSADDLNKILSDSEEALKNQ